MTGAVNRMRRFLPVLLTASLTVTLPALSEPVTVAMSPVTDWKAVYGTVEARDRIPARARLGGTLVELSVVEGDMVTVDFNIPGGFAADEILAGVGVNNQ